MLKENIQIRRFARLVPRSGETFASYIHGNGRIGVVVGVPGGDEALGKDSRCTSRRPIPVLPRVPRSARRSSRPSARSRARKRRRREAGAGRRADRGRKVEKFYQEAVLVEQPYVKDPDKTVGQMLVERGGKGALDLRFVRFKLGEGAGKAEEAPEPGAHGLMLGRRGNPPFSFGIRPLRTSLPHVCASPR
jgi:elongation factor Ts